MDRVEMAMEYHAQGYNCAQAVVLAYADKMGLDKMLAAKIAEPFGGGMGQLREVCGAFSGALMVFGSQKAQGEETDKKVRGKLYEETRQMAEEFQELAGSLICGELLKLPQEMPDGQEGNCYTRKPCSEYVRIAAEIVVRHI